MGDIREQLGTLGTEASSRKYAGPIDPGQHLPTYNHACCYVAV